jgi:hypothetical protein
MIACRTTDSSSVLVGVVANVVELASSVVSTGAAGDGGVVVVVGVGLIVDVAGRVVVVGFVMDLAVLQAVRVTSVANRIRFI